VSDDEASTSRRRRHLLRDAGAALAVALGAGCLSNPWEPGRDSQSAGTVAGGADPTTAATETATAPEGTTAEPPETGTGTATATPTPVPPAQREPAQVVEVAPDGFQYAPETFEISVGDTVHWEWKDGGHNVRVRSKPDGSDWTGTPGTDSDTYSEGYLHAHTFQVAGSYECYCAPHQSLGLEGSFEVR